MPRSIYASCVCCWSLLLVAAMLPVSPALAQEGTAASEPQFATGVLTTIPPDIDAEDTVSIHDIVELHADTSLEREPRLNTKSRTLFEMADDTVFRHQVWCLELSFKPLRMIHVDIPQASGKMQRKLIWYMVYRVKNTGMALVPEQQDDGNFTTRRVQADTQRFIPQFILASHDEGAAGGKEYLDRILPAAMPVIARREMPRGNVLDSVQMSEQLLAPQASLWGVAIWEDVDPEIDFFSIYAGGLTNAYRWKDVEKFKAGDPPGRGRTFSRKTLQLNFWRPGDELAENEREFRYGVAPGQAGRYGTDEGVAYRWIYR